jgi:hypothetical protein
MINAIERALSRKEAAQFLTDRGFRTAPATLAKLACLGGGPTFISFGRKPLYREADLIAWAEGRTTGPRRSTSDPGIGSVHSGQPAALATQATEPDIDRIVADALRSVGVTPARREHPVTVPATQ